MWWFISEFMTNHVKTASRLIFTCLVINKNISTSSIQCFMWLKERNLISKFPKSLSLFVRRIIWQDFDRILLCFLKSVVYYHFSDKVRLSFLKVPLKTGQISFCCKKWIQLHVCIGMIEISCSDSFQWYIAYVYSEIVENHIAMHAYHHLYLE